MKKCSICNSENVRNYPFELGFIPSHILHEDIVLPVNPKFNICMDCGHVFITDTAAVETIKKMDNLSTSVKTEKDKFVAKAKETIATVEAKIKALEEKIKIAQSKSVINFELQAGHNTLEEMEIISEIKPALDSYVKETTANFIAGNLDIDAEWDNYLAELENIGLSQYLEVISGVYARMYGTK